VKLFGTLAGSGNGTSVKGGLSYIGDSAPNFPVLPQAIRRIETSDCRFVPVSSVRQNWTALWF